MKLSLPWSDVCLGKMIFVLRRMVGRYTSRNRRSTDSRQEMTWDFDRVLGRVEKTQVLDDKTELSVV